MSSNLDSNIELIKTEYTKACEKHPVFCSKFTSIPTLEQSQNLETFTKACNDTASDKISADSILVEELYESITAYLQSDKEHCRQELAQVGAVVLRMMEYLENQ